MKRLEEAMHGVTRLVVAILPLLFLGVSGCQEEGPAEKAGKQIDRAVEKAGEKIEEAGEQVKKSVQ